MHQTLLDKYLTRVKNGDLSTDNEQHYAVSALSTLIEDIRKAKLGCIERQHAYHWRAHPEEMPEDKGHPKGVYLYGTVGRGKSMLMDIFLEMVPLPQKRRVHFHAFMEEVHHRMHHVKPAKGQDPLLKVASDISEEAAVLCFDEFYITNIADAMMLGRLFHMLFKLGVIVCATSNWKPEHLFKEGFNRMRYKPFITELESNMHVIDLGEGVDYRRRSEPHFPLMRFGEEEGNKQWLMDYFEEHAVNPSQGHDVFVRHKHIHTEYTADNILWTTFGALCKDYLSAEHYLELALKYDHFLLEDIQTSFSEADADTVYRFIVLIDILYEHKKRFVCTSDKPLTAIEGLNEVGFAFERTLSRLQEMQGF